MADTIVIFGNVIAPVRVFCILIHWSFQFEVLGCQASFLIVQVVEILRHLVVQMDKIDFL